MLNLVYKDLINRVSANSKLQSSKLSQYEFPSYLIICVGCIKISRIKRNGVEETFMVLPENMSKDYLNAWNKDVGRVVLNDLKHHRDDRYFELVTSTHKVLLRKILDEEYDNMRELGFTHVDIGDFTYMIVKEVPLDMTYATVNSTVGEELLASSVEYSNNTDIDTEDDTVEEEPAIESLSLF